MNLINEKIENLAHEWQEFKEVNDQKIKQLATKGVADPLTLDRLSKINDRMDKFETVLARPNLSSNAKSFEEDLEYKNAFENYLKKGVESTTLFGKKALSTMSASDGGYLVNSTISKNIEKAYEENSIMRKLASVERISSESLEILEDYDIAESGWTSEVDLRSETKSPKLSRQVIQTHELFAQPKATQKLLDDASINVGNWLSGKITETFLNKENHSFINGDGKGKPKGILNYQANNIEQITSGMDNALNADSIIRLYYSLKENYISKAVFLMNRATLKLIRSLKDPQTGQYLWQPNFMAGQPNSLMGIPVYESSDMPMPEKDALAIILADFKKAYRIVDRQAITIMRDPYTEKPFVKFYATKRVGGAAVNFDAVKILKLSK